jgi:hypothetical protein
MKPHRILAALCLIATGCASHPAQQMRQAKEEAATWQQLSAEPTPTSWAPGSRWRFTVADIGKPSRDVTFVVTDEPAETCISGTWKRLNISGDSALRLDQPAYSVSGRNLQILLSTDLCDAYNMLVGALQDGSFSGAHRFTGLGGSHDFGTVTGTALVVAQ